jgi:hypothetical protein
MSITFVGTNTPVTPAIGQVRFDTSVNQVQTWDGNRWVVITDGMGFEKKIVCEDLTFGSMTFYKVVTEGYDFDELNEWCNQTFGPPRTGPDPKNIHKWFISGGEIYFDEAKHREWFILKWSAT